MSNRLKNEDSPYLQQHAHNPIHWYPWGKEALQKAKEENKAIFLSIGYSSCHWCHVMEKESFEDKLIAELLNQHFIAIKVDKEERPDIDKHYQEVYRLMNRQAGGWPTSIFMTSNLEPFYSATYIAPKSQNGMLGFEELLKVIITKYVVDHKTLVEKGQEVLSFVNPKDKKIEATKLTLNIMDTIALHTDNLLDTKEGGFGEQPKFPHTSTIDLLFDTYQLTHNKSLLDACLLSLDGMSKGGMYDHVDGGFCRYSTDKEWLVPHFEKMTYDNALLAQLYLRAYQITKDDYYKKIAFETLDFMINKMSENNLFYSASDADTNGVEGEYFTYDYNDVVARLIENNYSNLEITQICNTLNITKEGNFEGKNIIRFNNPKEITLKNYDKVIKLLQTMRKEQEYPFIDKKIITSWNAMMINALFIASTIDAHYKTIAIDTLKALLKNMYINQTLYHSKLIHKEVKIKAFLEDYAYLGETLITAYQSTLDESYLIMATQCANNAIEQFYAYGKWNFSKGEFETTEDIYDSSYPSSVATILSLLLSISSLVEGHYKKFVFKTLEINSYSLMRQPLSSPKLSKMVLRYLKDDIILKSNEKILEKLIEEKDSLGYPYLLLKNTFDENMLLCNSHSCFAHTDNFKNLKPLLENYL